MAAALVGVAMLALASPASARTPIGTEPTVIDPGPTVVVDPVHPTLPPDVGVDPTVPGVLDPGDPGDPGVPPVVDPGDPTDPPCVDDCAPTTTTPCDTEGGSVCPTDPGDPDPGHPHEWAPPVPVDTPVRAHPSHGCIRVPNDAMARRSAILRLGTPVVVG